MPIGWTPTVSGNTRKQQGDIERMGSAPPGPMAIGPGDGHMRLHDGTNDTGYLDFEGLKLRYRGSLRGLTELTESFADSIEAHTVRLGEHGGRLDGHDSTLGQHGTRLDGHDGDISAHNTRINNAQSAANGAHTRLDGVDSTLSSHNSRINTAQARADSAYSRAGDALSAAATAQSRADDAHGDAGTAQSRADAAWGLANTAAQDAQDALILAGQMDAWLRANTGYPNGGLNPQG